MICRAASAEIARYQQVETSLNELQKPAIRFAPAASPWLIALTGFLAWAPPSEAALESSSIQNDRWTVNGDTARTGAAARNPLRFRKSVLFTPDYLSRLAEASSRERMAAEAGEREAEVRRFAERYGISRDLARSIHESAVRERIDPDLAFRLVWVESRFNPRARGPAGALGLAQLMPSTARALDRSVRTEAEILEPSTNLRLGFSYLRRLIDRYDGDVRLGLLAYNRGEGTVDRVLRTGRDPENGYSRKVLGTRSGDVYSGNGVLDP